MALSTLHSAHTVWLYALCAYCTKQRLLPYFCNVDVCVFTARWIIIRNCYLDRTFIADKVALGHFSLIIPPMLLPGIHLNADLYQQDMRSKPRNL
jgi:hypothetical protein